MAANTTMIAGTPTLLVDVFVEAKPVGKERPRFGAHLQPDGKIKRRTYTPAKTAGAELEAQRAWLAQGRPQLAADAYIGVIVDVVCPRPYGHFLVDGRLSSAGRRAGPYPGVARSDIDNVAKLVLDALNGYAWRDDAAISWLSIIRRYPTQISTAMSDGTTRERPGKTGYRVRAWDRSIIPPADWLGDVVAWARAGAAT